MDNAQRGGLAQQTAQPLIRRIFDRDFEVAPLRLRDWARLEEFIRAKIVGIAREQARHADTQEEAKEIMQSGWESACRFSLMGGEDGQFAETVEGLMTSADVAIETLFIAYRKNQGLNGGPFTRDDAETLLMDSGLAAELIGEIMSLSYRKNPVTGGNLARNANEADPS